MQSRGWTGMLAATFLVFMLEVAALPSPYAGFALEDVRRPIYRGNIRTRESKSDTEVIVKSDISVVGTDGDGRAAAPLQQAHYPSTTPTSMAESLKMVSKQLLQAPGATDMVATDVRTPPKVKSQVSKNQDNSPIHTDFVPLGKGEARPVSMEEAASYEIITSAPETHKSSTPSTGGLSTWILLSNGEQSTLASKKKGAVQPTADPKRPPKPTTAIPTIEKVTKKADDIKIMKPAQVKPLSSNAVKKVSTNSSKEEPPKASALILQDSKFRNRTPVVVGRIPAVQNKTSEGIITPVKNTVTPTQPTIITASHGSLVTKKKTSMNPTSPTRYDIVPTTSLLLETDPIVENSDENSTTETSTSKPSRRPGTKKKKKNKNRRRRPTKSDADTAESKIQETGVASNKIENGARPISTQIYNYLAREVMPSVGVGIVGLVLTAGLAGLLLYPFGGGIARRNYEKGSGAIHNPHLYYSYNSYSPHPEDPSGAQPEEKVFGQVLSSMNHNSFSPSYDATKYTTSNNKFRYDLHDYGNGNVNGYAGTSDYSTLPDSVKNDDFALKNSDFSAKTPDYSVKTTDYSIKNTDFAVREPVKVQDYSLPEASKYYSMDPVSSHYKLTDSAAQVDTYKPEETNYPALTEYTSYTNAASVGTVESFNEEDEDSKKNETTPGEDKSDKSAPQFSALVGSPQFTNTDFVGSVSLTGTYGAQDIVRHRTGMLAAEHGPRSLLKDDKKKEEKANSRRKRAVHDDFSNEIDGDEHPRVSSSTPMPISSTNVEPTDKDLLTTEETSTDVNDLTTFRVPTETTVVTPTFPPDSDLGSPNPSGFLGFLSRLAQMKLKIGISLLRSTGEAFTKYLEHVTRRMEAAVRTMESSSLPNFKRRSVKQTDEKEHHSSRNRRDTFKLKKRSKKYNGKLLKH